MPSRASPGAWPARGETLPPNLTRCVLGFVCLSPAPATAAQGPEGESWPNGSSNSGSCNSGSSIAVCAASSPVSSIDPRAPVPACRPPAPGERASRKPRGGAFAPGVAGNTTSAAQVLWGERQGPWERFTHVTYCVRGVPEGTGYDADGRGNVLMCLADGPVRERRDV